MSKRIYYVNDHGDIFRMTEDRYRRYLLAGTREDTFPDASRYGSYIGHAITVNNFTTEEFSEEHRTVVAPESPATSIPSLRPSR